MGALLAMLGPAVATMVGEKIQRQFFGSKAVPKASGAPMGKAALSSKTIQGLIVTAFGSWISAKLSQYGISPEEWQATVELVIQLVGALWALYGRVKASTPIGIAK